MRGKLFSKKIISFFVVLLMAVTLIIPMDTTKALAIDNKDTSKVTEDNVNKDKDKDLVQKECKPLEKQKETAIKEDNVNKVEEKQSSNIMLDKSLQGNKKKIGEDLIHSGAVQVKDGKTLTWNDITNAVDVIDVLSINDFHGAVMEHGKNIGAAKMAAQIKKMKKENPNTILTTGGDLYQGTAMSNLLQGKPVNEFLKQVKVDVSAVGNHEFDWGKEMIPKWGEEGNFEFLAANIYDSKTNKPVEWAKPYKIIEKNGKRIAFIGLATPETKFKTIPMNVADLDFKNPTKIANYWADYLRKNKNVDAVLVVSHLGSKQDWTTHEIVGEAADLARGAKGIDAIISGHTHLPADGEINGIPIVQAACNGRALADISLVFDKNGKLKKVYHSLDLLYKRVDKLPEDIATKNAIDKCTEKLKPILDEEVCCVDCDLTRGEGVTRLGQFVTKYMCKATNSQIGITNGGGLRMPLQKGKITVGDMWGVMPFANTLVTMKLKGSDLKRVLENGIANPNIGWAQFYGVKVYYNDKAKLGNKITSMRLLDGTKIEMDKCYDVVTNDFMYAKGDNYDFTGAVNAKDTQESIRDALIRELKKEKNVHFGYEESLFASADPIKDKDVKPIVIIPQGNKDNNKQEINPAIKVDKDKDGKVIALNNNSVKLNKNTNKSSEESTIKEMPQTGNSVGTSQILIFSMILIMAGVTMLPKNKKEENKVA